MNFNQLKHMQRSRTRKKKPHVDIRIEHCRYCGESLVRLKTVARCFKVIRLETHHVVWKDGSGTTRRDGILTKDHVMPRSKGGATSPENLVFSCGPCNFKKADRIGVLLEDGSIFLHQSVAT